MNIDLAQRVLMHIKAHKEAFDIRIAIEIDPYNNSQVLEFPCGTVACIAGWTILLSEDKIGRSFAIEDIEELENWTWDKKRDVARFLLGIHEYEADELFASVDSFGNERSDEDAIDDFKAFIKSKKETL